MCRRKHSFYGNSVPLLEKNIMEPNIKWPEVGPYRTNEYKENRIKDFEELAGKLLELEGRLKIQWVERDVLFLKSGKKELCYKYQWESGSLSVFGNDGYWSSYIKLSSPDQDIMNSLRNKYKEIHWNDKKQKAVDMMNEYLERNRDKR